MTMPGLPRSRSPEIDPIVMSPNSERTLSTRSTLSPALTAMSSLAMMLCVPVGPFATASAPGTPEIVTSGRSPIA